MDILEQVENFYDLAYKCYSYFAPNATFNFSRQGALNVIFLSNDEDRRLKFLGIDAYIDMKRFENNIKQGNLEGFLDFFDDTDMSNFSTEKKMRYLVNSLNDGGKNFEKILVTKKLRDYFPLENIESYIKSKI